MAKSTKSVNELAYEQALSELETILQGMEGEAHTLDESMGMFERGRALLEHCQTLLQQAELKVRVLDGELSEGLADEAEA